MVDVFLVELKKGQNYIKDRDNVYDEERRLYTPREIAGYFDSQWATIVGVMTQKRMMDRYGEALLAEIEQVKMALVLEKRSLYFLKRFMHLWMVGMIDMAGIWTKTLMGVEWLRKIPTNYQDVSRGVYSAGNWHCLVGEVEGWKTRELTLVEVQDPNWVNKVSGMREKIDGTPFTGDGEVLVGPWSIKIPILKAECKGGIFYVVEPRIEDEFVYKGFLFKPHNFEARVDIFEEGLILDMGEEVKVKRFPSVEVDIEFGKYKGMEIEGAPDHIPYIVGEICLQDTGYYWMRERYGKRPTSPIELYKKASTVCLVDLWKKSCSSIESWEKYSTRKKIEGKVYEHSEVTILQLGKQYHVLPRSIEVNEWEKWIKAIMEMNGIDVRLAGKVNLPTPFHFLGKSLILKESAKLIVKREKDFLLIKEEHKKWDLVGGRRMIGETFMDAMLREFREETGYQILEDECNMVWEELQYDNGILYDTVLFEFIGRVDYRFDKMRKLKTLNPDEVVLWVKGYCSKHIDVIGSSEILGYKHFDSYTYVSKDEEERLGLLWMDKGEKIFDPLLIKDEVVGRGKKWVIREKSALCALLYVYARPKVHIVGSVNKELDKDLHLMKWVRKFYKKFRKKDTIIDEIIGSSPEYGPKN